jgi:hypothetical protein
MAKSTRVARGLRHLAVGAAVILAVLADQVAASEAWPAAVNAKYKLRFNGIEVGQLGFTSKIDRGTYALAGNGQISVLFGAIKFTGVSNVAGTIEAVDPVPKTYGFDWKKNKKGGAIKLAFAGRKAVGVSVEPPPDTHDDLIPVTDQHKVGVLDPLSAIMALTRADTAKPCDRRVRVFDGKQRFDIVFSYKRKTLIAASKANESSSVGFVCRAMYEPIAGHRDNAASKSYAANRDAEVVLRKVAGSDLLIPQSVTVPSAWGTGTMVVDQIEVTSASGVRFALKE